MGFCYQGPEAWLRTVDLFLDVGAGESQCCRRAGCDRLATVAAGWCVRGSWRSTLLCDDHAVVFARKRGLATGGLGDDSASS